MWWDDTAIRCLLFSPVFVLLFPSVYNNLFLKATGRGKTDHEKTALQRHIDATDRQIDQLVYELYGLTEKEIGIIEN